MTRRVDHRHAVKQRHSRPAPNQATYGVMVGVRHSVGNLGPSHAVLDGHLVWRATDHGRFHGTAASRHVTENGRSDFLFFVPPAAPRAQAHQRQHDNGYCRHRRADRYAQHFSVDLTLRPVKRSGTPVNNQKMTLLFKTALFFFTSHSRTLFSFCFRNGRSSIYRSVIGHLPVKNCYRVYIFRKYYNNI